MGSNAAPPGPAPSLRAGEPRSEPPTPDPRFALPSADPGRSNEGCESRGVGVMARPSELGMNQRGLNAGICAFVAVCPTIPPPGATAPSEAPAAPSAAAAAAARSFSTPSQRNAGLRESTRCVFSMSRRDDRMLAMSYRRLTFVLSFAESALEPSSVRAAASRETTRARDTRKSCTNFCDRRPSDFSRRQSPPPSFPSPPGRSFVSLSSSFSSFSLDTSSLDTSSSCFDPPEDFGSALPSLSSVLFTGGSLSSSLIIRAPIAAPASAFTSGAARFSSFFNAALRTESFSSSSSRPSRMRSSPNSSAPSFHSRCSAAGMREMPCQVYLFFALRTTTSTDSSTLTMS